MVDGTNAAGFAVFVKDGTVNNDQIFVCTNADGSDVVGTDALDFANINATIAAAGADTDVQYNSGGNFAGDAGFTYDGNGAVASTVSMTSALMSDGAGSTMTGGVVAGVTLTDGTFVSTSGIAAGNVLTAADDVTTPVKSLSMNATLTNPTLTIANTGGTDGASMTELATTFGDGTDTGSMSKTVVVFGDGADTGSMSKTTVSVADATDSTNVTKTSIVVADATNSSTVTKTSVVVAGATDTTTMSGVSVQTTDGTETATFNKSVVSVADATHLSSLASDKLILSEAANGIAGQVTLAAGTSGAIANTNVTASSRAFLTVVAIGGTPGAYHRATAGAGTLTIEAVDASNALVATDTSTLNYFIVN